MMPQDISGKPMYNMRTGKEEIFHGPVVGTNVLVADEINRATPKAQAALLEAMEEKQVTIGKHLFSLEKVFIVLATRNPIERDGTYDLPEAQLDRFGFQPHIESWSPETGMTMLADPKYYLDVSDRLGQVQKVISLSEIINLREAIFKKFYVEPRLDRYIVDLCLATHNDESVEHGSSPRGAIMLKKAATVAAFLEGRGYDGTRKYFEKLNVVIPGFNFVVPEDVRTYAVDVLAHRIFLFPKARYDDKKITPAGVIEKVLREVEEPRQI